MAPIWLLLALTPVSCVLPPSDEDPDAPIKNVRMETGRKALTWDVAGNVSEVSCSLNGSSPEKAKGNRDCRFRVLRRCQAANFTVRATLRDGSVFSTWLQHPRLEGEPDSAAERLACRVHGVHLLTCAWAAGRAAPRDVQYHLYLENTNTGRWWPCPEYTADERGTHVQCRFGDISGFSENLYRFLVNGTSRDAPVRCSELVTTLSDIEKPSPPNVTATCNRSDSVLEWETSRCFNGDFGYDLEIQEGTDAPYVVEDLQDATFVLKSPRAYAARVRVVCGESPGEWSARQRFACDHEDDAHLHIWVIPSVAAVATLLTVGIAVLLCRRCSVLQTLFPPIPHMKDPLGDDPQHKKMMTWASGRAGQEECPVADVQVLAET